MRGTFLPAIEWRHPSSYFYSFFSSFTLLLFYFLITVFYTDLIIDYHRKIAELQMATVIVYCLRPATKVSGDLVNSRPKCLCLCLAWFSAISLILMILKVKSQKAPKTHKIEVNWAVLSS
jgi:hypothetical protein